MRWKVVWLEKGHPDLDGAHGRIEGPFVKGKRIWLEKGQSMDDMLDTVIHEMAHGAGWNLADEWVHAFANDVVEGIKKLGFRIVADTE